jgi:hypothetical protein
MGELYSITGEPIRITTPEPAVAAEAGMIKRGFSVVGSGIAYPFKKGWGLIKWGWNGSGSLISDGVDRAKDMFTDSKPYWDSSHIGDGSNKKLWLGIGAVVLAVGALVGLSKLGKAASAGVDPEAQAQREAERTMMANALQATSANQNMYNNQGKWAQNAPQPAASYQQAAIDQASQQSINLQK